MMKEAMIEGEKVRLRLFDTVPSSMRPISPSFIENNHLYCIVVDASYPIPFSKATEWAETIRAKSLPMIVVGNKVDRDRLTSRKEIEEFVEKWGLDYIEVSAKTGHNIQQLLIKAIELINYSRPR